MPCSFTALLWIPNLAPQSVALVKRMESLQRRATKYILNLPFRCDTTYNERPTLLNLLPLCYWHEFLDMVTFYKTNARHHDHWQQLTTALTRQQQQQKRNNVVWSKSSVIYSGTMQNLHLPKIISQQNKENLECTAKSLTNNNISLGQFKNGLCKYYKSALKDVFDVDNPKTWKSICLSC